MATYSPGVTRAPSMVVRLTVALIVLGVGLAVGIYGGVTGADRFAYPLSSPYQSGSFTQHLQTGRYLVYAAPTNGVRETPANLTVQASDGKALTVTAFGGNQTQTRSGTTYSAYAQFNVPSVGTYDFSLATNGPPRIIVAKTLLDTAKSLARPAVETVIGALVALIGFIMLLRTFTRRWWRLQDTRALWNGPSTEFAAPDWTTTGPAALTGPAMTAEPREPASPPPGGFT